MDRVLTKNFTNVFYYDKRFSNKLIFKKKILKLEEIKNHFFDLILVGSSALDDIKKNIKDSNITYKKLISLTN